MKKIIVLILMGLSMLSCSDNNDDNVNETNCDSEVIISSQGYTNASFDGLTINSLEITDDCLKVTYSASGCDGDSWELELIDSEAILESFPVQRNLTFSFTNEEACLAYFTKEKTFDISNLQLEEYNSIWLNITGFEDSILYQYRIDDVSARQLITDGVDVDGDGKLDFELDEYEIQTNDVPSSAGSLNLFLKPIGDNQLLYKSGERNLFLIKGDVIKSEVEDDFQWQSNLIELIGKSRSFDVYDEFWSIHSDLTDDFYIAFKLISGDEEKIGWLKLEFDLTTGEIYLLDSVITNANELMI